MNTLPLFYYPTTWLWVDDDKLLLENMVLAFQNYNNIRPFHSAKECLNFLKDYKSPFAENPFLKSLSYDESYGTLQHTLTDFDVTMLSDIANNPYRHQEISAIVIDYKMPEMDGFTFANEVTHLPVEKILLTGAAQSNDAITGFNNNLIHRYVQKYEADLVTKLTAYLQQITLHYFQRISMPLISLIETEKKLPISDPVFIKHFEQYCKDNEIQEYYLIDKEGSYLCIDKKNRKKCFVVQSDKSMDYWLSSYGSELSPKELTPLLEKKCVPFFGIGKEAWQVDSHEWKNYFYTPGILDGRERYYWTALNL